MADLFVTLLFLWLVFLVIFVAFAFLTGVLASSMKVFQVIRDSVSAFRHRGLQTPF